MAKKKNKKRHIAKQPAVEPAAKTTSAKHTAAKPAAVTATTATEHKEVAARHAEPLTRADYARGDVRRIGILAGTCLVLLGATWAALNFTGLGATIYGLIKL